jgi:hypothetical protein
VAILAAMTPGRSCIQAGPADNDAAREDGVPTLKRAPNQVVSASEVCVVLAVTAEGPPARLGLTARRT